MEKKICYGCGAILQHDSINQVGYVPENAKNQNLCQRCFKLLHYHKNSNSFMNKDDFLKILNMIGNKDALIVYIVDLFDFSGSLIPGLIRHIGYNDILLVGNKRDLLPKSLKDNKIKNWLRMQMNEQGIKVQDVFLTSSKKGYYLDDIYDAIDYYRKGRDVYVVGMTNVGKSTFINLLLKHYSNVERMITTSEFPGTTLNMIEIPLDEYSSLYDTPGIINDGQMTHYIDERDLKQLIPQVEIRAKTYQIDPLQSIYLDGLARIDYLEGSHTSMTIYCSRYINIHRCKLSKADSLYDNLQILKLFPKTDRLKDYSTYTFHLKGDRCEISISGLGFVRMNMKGRVEVKVPKGVDVTIRKALI